MSAIERLKIELKEFDKYCNDTRGDWSDFDGRELLSNWNDLKKEINEAIVCLEQKEKLRKWLESNIKKDVEKGSFTDWWTDGHITALKEVLELIK